MKKITFILTFLLIFILHIDSVYADYSAQVVKTTKCSLKSNATGSCIYANTNFNSIVSGPYWVDVGDKLTVITSKPEVEAPKEGTGSECKSNYVYIKIAYNSTNYNGYVCKDDLWDGTISDEMKQEFIDAGFYDETYYPSLALLKTAHPKWKFVAIDTGLNFGTAVNNEDSGNKSLIQYTSSVNALGYLSTKEGNYTWTTDKYKVYDGSNWYAANNATIAYHMDPRNFLNENYIWQFESLSYDKDTQTEAVVKALLKGQYIEKFSQFFVSAGASANVNPVYLASLSKQEVGGTTANVAIKGGAFTYGGKSYSGLYNFYNIGATSGSDGLAVYRGLVYANGGSDGSATSYSRPWKNEEKAVLGGAQFTAASYIAYGQITSYFKKWNVVAKFAEANKYKVNANYTHQYMQNIQAPKSEAYSTFKSYYSLNMIDLGYTFYIPVYKSMPAKTSLPNTKSPNNYLKSLTVNSKSVTGFNGDTQEYKMAVDEVTSSIEVGATAVRTDATITGVGTKELVYGDNEIVITVKAANGTNRTYKIIVTRPYPTGEYKKVEEIIEEAKINVDETYITGLSFTTSIANMTNLVNSVESKAKVVIKRASKEITTGNLQTGDVITITSGTDSKNYTIVLYGDVNGDGVINTLDMLLIQRHRLGYSKLTGASLKSADVNRDGTINSLDMLLVQRHRLGIALISQK